MNNMQYYFLCVSLFCLYVSVLCEEAKSTLVNPCIFDQSENKTSCSNPNLNAIPAKAISQLTTHLEIHNTSINEIDNNVFEELPTLLIINLAGNGIWKIDSNAFANLTKLNDLKLSSNVIDSIAGSFPPNLRTLRKLNISHNELTMLNNGDLSHLTDLLHLDLSWNHIKFIENRSFFMLTALETLYLNHNSMKTIAVKLRSHSLDSVSLYDNPWDCSCSSISAIHPVTFDHDSVVCSTPKEMNNKTLSGARKALFCVSQSTVVSVSPSSSSVTAEGSGAVIIPTMTPETTKTSSVAKTTGSSTSSAAVTAKKTTSLSPGSTSKASTTKASGSSVTTKTDTGASPGTPNVSSSVGPTGSSPSVATSTTPNAASLTPEIHTVPRTVVVIVAAGHPVNISCHNTTDGANLSWHKDHVTVNNKAGSPLINDKIEIKSATKQDGGTYCCATVNENGHRNKSLSCQHLRVKAVRSSTSPAVYVAVIILVVIGVSGVAVLLFRRYRRNSVERYGLLSNRNAFRADESSFRQESDDYL